MSFWMIATALTLLSLAPMALALSKTDTPMQGPAQTDIKVYKDQLAEVERDLMRGTLGEADAKRTRLEISRRLLDADKNSREQTLAARTLPTWTIAVLCVTVIAAAAALYWQLGAPSYSDLPLERRLELAQEFRETRPTQAQAEAAGPQAQPIQTPDPQHVELVAQLQAAMQSRPDDLQGQTLLARNASAIGQYRTAHAAHARILDIKDAAATSQDYADYADSLILAAGGYIAPEAEAAITQSLSLDPLNPTANYYAGEMFDQIGRPDLTLTVWSDLLERSSAQDPWAAPILARIEYIAELAGVRYTLPSLPTSAPTGSTLNGPDTDDVAAAADMAPEDRAAFIQSMVDQLSARLANSGGSPAEWAQLIMALGVIGDTERADAIWTEAQVVFGSNEAAIDTIRNAAQSAGVAP